MKDQKVGFNLSLNVKKCEFCHRLLALMPFQTCHVVLQNTKVENDALKKTSHNKSQLVLDHNELSL